MEIDDQKTNHAVNTKAWIAKQASRNNVKSKPLVSIVIESGSVPPSAFPLVVSVGPLLFSSRLIWVKRPQIFGKLPFQLGPELRQERKKEKRQHWSDKLPSLSSSSLRFRQSPALLAILLFSVNQSWVGSGFAHKILLHRTVRWQPQAACGRSLRLLPSRGCEW